MSDITSLGGLTNYYTEMIQKNQSTSKIDTTLSSDLTTATDEELLEACKTFEAYFLEQIFKGMQKMVPEHEYEETTSKTQMEYVQEQLISEYAATATDSNGGTGIGLAQMLYEQMKRNVEG